MGAIVGIVGGAAGVIGVAFSASAWRRERARDRLVREDAKRAVFVACQEVLGSDDYGSEALVAQVTATNEGHRPVVVREILFRTHAGRDLPIPEFSEPKLPARLEDGDAVTVDVLAELIEVAQNQVGVTAETAVVVDTRGNEYFAPYKRL